MNKLIKIVLCCLVCALPACNKTGAYGFKEGQTYVSKRVEDGKEYRATKVTMDYVIFTMEGAKPPSPWYNRKVSGAQLMRWAYDLVLKD